MTGFEEPPSQQQEEAREETSANGTAPHLSTTTPTAQVLPLDWTQLGNASPASRIRYPSDVDEGGVDPEEEQQCMIVGTAGMKITHLGPDFSSQLHPHLKQLVLRSHLIRKIEGLQHFKSLKLLELYDNQVEVLEGLDEGENGTPGTTITTLDMSYNVIREMTPVELCPNLVELYLANNKLKTIDGLKGLMHLKKIDLGANRIRYMDPDQLSGLVELEELWLGKNKIEEITGLEALKKLRRLDIQSNRLTKVEQLQTQQDTLEELYLAHNAIDNDGASQPTGLALTFRKLSVLDLNRNRLTSTDPLVHQPALEELWISGNEIASFEDVQSLTHLKAPLETIYLEYNPLQRDPLYRKKVRELIPDLKQIDADLIGGLAAHGIPTVTTGSRQALTEEAQLRQLQEQVMERARAETKSS